MPESLNEKTLLDLFKAIIRYTASGFIFIVALKFFLHDSSIWSFTDKDNLNWSSVITAGICGVILYSFHLAILDDVFYYFSLKYLIKANDDNDSYLPNEFYILKDDEGRINKKGISRIKFTLTTHRLERPGTDNKVLQMVQDYLDHQFAILVFAYTSSYSLLSLTVFFTIKNIITCKWPLLGFDGNYFLIAMLGIGLLIAGFMLDIKITKRELFMIKKNESDQVVSL